MSDTHKTESLHDQIMRLPRDPAEYTNVNMMLAYKDGHRDARHAAAELAAAYEADAQQAAPAGWKLVPVEPTNAMWTAVNKLDDEMVAGGYDGKGCSIEQAWSCMLAAAPTPPAGPWESPCTTPAQQPVAVKSHGAWDGLELLAEQPDGTELYAAQPAQQIDQLRHERDALAEAIGKAAARVGLVAPDTPLTGPMLLMLCDDIAECCLSAESAATPAQQPVAWQDPDNLERMCSARCMDDAKRVGGATLMAVLPLTRPLYAAPPAQQSPLYTCIGKGGRYEKVGSAKPAGIAHFEHNIGAVIVYRDIESDHLYFRLPLDFNRRMKRIDDGDTAAPEQAEQDALKVPRELKDGEFRDLVNELRDIACEYYGTEQLRERIAHALRRALLGGGE